MVQSQLTFVQNTVRNPSVIRLESHIHNTETLLTHKKSSLNI